MADSDSSDDVEMMDIDFLPLGEIELGSNNSSSKENESDEDDKMRQKAMPIITRRARRRSSLFGTPLLPSFHANFNNDAVPSAPFMKRVQSSPFLQAMSEKPAVRKSSITGDRPKLPPLSIPIIERPKPSKSIKISLLNNHHNNQNSSKSSLSPICASPDGHFSMSPKVKYFSRSPAISPYQRAKMNWMRALKKVRSIEDPWEKLGIFDLPVENVRLHRYNALKKRWIESDAQVKMEKEPFNHGAMRSCYRMKKMSTFSRSKDWSHASNYVAKLYMEEVERDVYFSDVKLQSDAKLWGEEYSRHNPPKKVDILQMSVVEFTDRPNKPLYHLEHFIEGNYIKYNSNSGFVDESSRSTPHAFSHFTFERSGHKLIVVDVQGVGDLWTDPQIHTSEGEEYGDGNLGPRGMALFFHSHQCNSICESLGLSKFDLATSEITDHDQTIKIEANNSMTRVRGEEFHCFSASPRDRSDLTGFLLRSRSRTTSMASQSSDDPMSPRSPPTESDFDSEEPMSPGSPLLPEFRPRLYSESSQDSQSINDDDSLPSLSEEERIRFQQSLAKAARPSCINAEMNMFKNLTNGLLPVDDSILGQIHHEMAKYHECGRFVLGTDKKPDNGAALYHEEHAAELGVLEARITLSRLYLGMQREVLTEIDVEQNDENINKGIMYMEMAADAGDHSSMCYLAHAYETGYGLGTERSQCYDQACKWLEKAIATASGHTCDGQVDSSMDNPTYQLQAKVAELYLSGDYGLEKDPNYAGEMYTAAADGAMAEMKGRLANKYYMLAEEAWAQVEEPED